MIVVVMCAWNSVPKPSVLAESCLSTYGALGLLDCRRALGSLLQRARLGWGDICNLDRLTKLCGFLLRPLKSECPSLT